MIQFECKVEVKVNGLAEESRLPKADGPKRHKVDSLKTYTMFKRRNLDRPLSSLESVHFHPNSNEILF